MYSFVNETSYHCDVINSKYTRFRKMMKAELPGKYFGNENLIHVVNFVSERANHEAKMYSPRFTILNGGGIRQFYANGNKDQMIT